MAFVFDRVSKLLGEQNANIFQGQQGGDQPQRRQGFKLTGDGGQAAGGQGAQVKDAGGGAQPQAMALTSGAANQEIAAKNQPQSSQGVLGNVASAIQGQEQKLQQQAEQYGQTAEQQRSKLVEDRPSARQQVEKAFNEGDYETIGRALRGEKQDIKAFETDISPESIQVPKSRDELASYLQGQKSGEYTKGMSRLDAALLGKSQGFQQEQEQLTAKKQALQAQRDKALGLTAQEQGELQQQAEYESQMVRKALEGLGQDILKTGTRGKSDFQNRLSSGPSKEQADAAFQEALLATGLDKADISAADLRAAVDPSKFYAAQAGEGSEDLLNYLGDPEYQRYSKVMELLGQTPGERRAVGMTGSFDQRALQDLLAAEGGKLKEKRKAEVAKILEGKKDTKAVDTIKESPVKAAAEQQKEVRKSSPSDLFGKIGGTLKKSVKKNVAKLPGKLVAGMR